MGGPEPASLKLGEGVAKNRFFKGPPPPPPASLRFLCLAWRPNEPLFHFLPFLSNRFLPSALGVVGSSRVWAHVRVSDHVHTGACAGASRQCGVRARPPRGRGDRRFRPPFRCTRRVHDREPAVCGGTRSVVTRGRVTRPAFFALSGPALVRRDSNRERPRPCGPATCCGCQARRPRAGAPMGFSMTASGPGRLCSRRPWPARAPGFFQGSTGAWRSRLRAPA